VNRIPKGAWYAVAAVLLTALWAWKTGYLFPEPSLDPNPLAYRRGEEVLRARCLHCHATIPLAPRVAGWTPEYAFDALANLPALQPAMPRFAGTEQERADLAIYLSVLGQTAAARDAAAAGEQGEPDWRPPRWLPPEPQPAGARPGP
jgi:hypothetical protein